MMPADQLALLSCKDEFSRELFERIIALEQLRHHLRLNPSLTGCQVSMRANARELVANLWKAEDAYVEAFMRDCGFPQSAIDDMVQPMEGGEPGRRVVIAGGNEVDAAGDQAVELVDLEAASFAELDTDFRRPRPGRSTQ